MATVLFLSSQILYWFYLCTLSQGGQLLDIIPYSVRNTLNMEPYKDILPCPSVRLYWWFMKFFLVSWAQDLSFTSCFPFPWYQHLYSFIMVKVSDQFFSCANAPRFLCSKDILEPVIQNQTYPGKPFKPCCQKHPCFQCLLYQQTVPLDSSSYLDTTLPRFIPTVYPTQGCIWCNSLKQVATAIKFSHWF